MEGRIAIPAWLGALAQDNGIERRTLLRLLGTGGVAAVLMACAETRVSKESHRQTDRVPAASKPPPFFKNTEPFITHGEKGLESRLEDMQGFITPNRLFFVRIIPPASALTLRLGGLQSKATPSPGHRSFLTRTFAACPVERLPPILSAQATSAPCSTV